MIRHPYLRLTVPQQLSKENASAWFKTAKDHLPAGLPAQAEIKMNGSPKSSSGYVQKHGDLWHYIVPTSRDPLVPEVQKLALSWNEAYPEGDFEIDYSTAGTAHEQHRELQEIGLQEIALEAAKSCHSQWVNEMSGDGWSYGIKFDQKNKRNPMIMPWEQLSSKIKLRELKRFEKLMEVLDRMDLQLIRKRK